MRHYMFLESKFEMKDISEANVILGVRIIRKRDSILLPKNNTLRNFLGSLDIMNLN